MTDLAREMGDLGKQVAELEIKLGDIAGAVAELRIIMAPFLTRYEERVQVYFDRLAHIQREIADAKALLGDHSATGPGGTHSPLDRFAEEASVEEQYARLWQGKQAPRPTGPLHLTPATTELKRMYARLVACLHPDFAKERSEQDRRQGLLHKVNEAYVRRDEFTMKALADTYCAASNLPALVDDHAVSRMRDQMYVMETLINKLEGLHYDLRYGMLARIKARAEQAWSTERRDLIEELSIEIRHELERARGELDALNARLQR